MLNELVKQIYENAKAKGFWETDRDFLHSLMLVTCEIAESAEEYRKGYHPGEVYFDGDKPEGVPVELADAIIRILDLCGRYEIDIDKVIEMKMAYNSTRPYKHGKIA